MRNRRYLPVLLCLLLCLLFSVTAFAEEPDNAQETDMAKASESVKAAQVETITISISGNSISWTAVSNAAKYRIITYYTVQGKNIGGGEEVGSTVRSKNLGDLLKGVESQDVRIRVEAYDSSGSKVGSSSEVTTAYTNPHTLIAKTTITVTEPAVAANPEDSTYFVTLYKPTGAEYTGTRSVSMRFYEILDGGGYSGWDVNGFKESTAYRVIITITLPSGVYLDREYEEVDGRATLNGHNTVMRSQNGFSTITVIYDFPTLAKGITEATIGITAPEIGAAPSYNPSIPSGANYKKGTHTEGIYKNDVRWYDITEKRFLTPGEETFQMGHSYEVGINLLAKDGYQFSAKATGTINGKEAKFTNYPVGMVNTNGVPVGLYEYVFPALGIPVITKQPNYGKSGPGMEVSFSVTAAGSDIKYQWQYMKPGESTWNDVYKNGKSSTYTFTAEMRHNNYTYRCKLTNPATEIYGEPVYTEERWLMVYEKPENTSEPGSVKAAVGATATFSVNWEGKDFYVRWEQSADGGKTWKEVDSSTASYTSNWHPTTLTVNVTGELNGYRYRSKAFNAAGASYSESATLTVKGVKPAIVTQPVSQSVAAGETASFKVAAVSDTAKSYQWQYRTGSSGSWTNVAKNGTSATYKLTTAARHNGYQYRCKVTNTSGSTYSGAAKLTVVTAKPTITTQPANQTVAVGKKATFKVVADGAASYQWQYRTSSTGEWKNVSVSSGKTATYSLTTAAKHNGYQYRCTVTNALGSVNTKVVKLTVVTEAPTIKTQPENQSVTAGKTATFSVTASGRGLSYQWQYRTSSSGEWKNVAASSGKTATYSLTAAAKHNGYQYRCTVTNAMGSVTTKTVKLTVK